MKKMIRLGVAGLGGRGLSFMKACWLPREDVKVVAVCDPYEDRMEAGVQAVKDAYNDPKAEIKGYTDHKQMLAEAKLDAVYIASSWQTHVGVAIDAMKAGVAAASEVGCGFSIEELWKLVYTQEETGVPCMLMENCCYGRKELAVLNMIKDGVFGELVHIRGGYQHDLRSEVSGGRENRHYRIDNYKHRNCDNYPTHELGPIARMLNINHGNRMLSLVSMTSKSVGLHEYLKNKENPNPEIVDFAFAQGDVTTTMIKCAHGETILLTLDTTLPRPYSRGLRVEGTKAIFQEDNNSIFIDGVHNKTDEFEWDWTGQYNNFDAYYDKYDAPEWKEFMSGGIKGGHGGIDWLEAEDFIHALKNDLPMPIDVYDFASWYSISVLSEQSIAMGSAPVAIPDFTNGKWLTR